MLQHSSSEWICEWGLSQQKWCCMISLPGWMQIPPKFSMKWCHRSDVARNVNNTVVALPMSSSDTYSRGEWLIPPRHLTNSMPICTAAIQYEQLHSAWLTYSHCTCMVFLDLLFMQLLTSQRLHAGHSMLADSVAARTQCSLWQVFCNNRAQVC